QPVKLPAQVSYPALKQRDRDADLEALRKTATQANRDWEKVVARLGEVREALIANADGDKIEPRQGPALEETVAQEAAVEEARVHEARLRLASLQSRMAADDVKYQRKEGDLAALAKTACEDERRAAVAAAKVSFLEGEKLAASAAEMEKSSA